MNDNSNKISLSMLRGKSANQSVPTISFRFNTGSDDLIKIYEKEEKDELRSSSVRELTPEMEISSSSRESSPSGWDGKGLSHRSSSLDDSTSLVQEVPVSKSSDSSSLISRLTKTVEHKLNEIRNEKQKEKDSKLQTKDGGQISSQESALLLANSDIGSTTSRAIESMKKFSLDSKESVDNSSSPSKVKTSLVQDFTEQTNKLKSDFNKNFRPKISELRNRKSLKDSSGSPKIRSSIFQSLLGRDDGIPPEDLLQECHAVDTAVEASEDGLDLLDTERENQNKIDRKDSDISEKQDRVSAVIQDTENVTEKHIQNTMEYNPRHIYRRLLQEIIARGKSINSKYFLGLLFLCFVFPLPSFLSGTIFGSAITLFIVYIFLQVVMTESDDASQYGNIMLPNYSVRSEDNLLHVGWMNELDTPYYPESYHVSQTHTVLLRLQGSRLQIDNSRAKISKHSRPNEEPQYGGFVHHREYDLIGSEVLLLPINLPRKWLWSRKYPIFIKFPTQSASKRSPSPEISRRSTPTKTSHTSRSLSPDDDDDDIEESSGSMEVQYSQDRSSAEDEAMNLLVDLESYEEVTQDMCHEASLCLFARTDREKDDWFRRFVAASEKKFSEKMGGISCFFAPTPEVEVSIPFEAPPPPPSPLSPPDTEQKENNDVEKEVKSPPPSPSYEQHMARIMHKDFEGDVGVSWFNSFVGRMLFDFLHDRYWANKIQERVQRKLSKLHIPYFVGEIVVSGIELGNCIPQLVSAGKPTLDHRGLWVDLSVSYSGSFRMTLETKLDLMKLKAKSPTGGTSSNPPSPNDSPFVPYGGGRTRSYARSPSSDCVLRNVQFDTDTDDSVESSSEDEQAEDELGERAPGGGPASRRFLRIVDTVTASRYFQQASEWGLLQKAMKGVSNTRIELGVEVRRLKGTLTLNVPPAPSDRLWYGFRGSPELIMVAKPCLGERQLDTLPFLAEFIQKQLKTVFEKVFVLPNMDDLVIPVMSPILPGQQEPLRPPWDTQPTNGRNPTPSPKTSPTKTNISLDLSQSFQKLKETYDE